MTDGEGTAFARWLREEMPKHGYRLDGPRAGGTAQLSNKAGVSRASLSRIVNGEGQPSLEALRLIGRVLGYRLDEMMVVAEVATAQELGRDHDDTADERPELRAVPDVQLGRDGDPDPEQIFGKLAPHEVRIWSETVLPWEAREAAIRTIRQIEARSEGGNKNSGRSRQRWA